ncbi:conserved hypothetical protein [Neospora caninum Liverpool]|uniref:Uncharacterized protein n=1 Tax=Neospora caninum (strain Liverpool) TaxID=572307 RepID=F0VN32_NEOCL|nr:conserved hypothetical protein [Neospora caninum Liverpool]CBZ55128.1 conserved hypothetical protein [Neospora caninum Liverpool]CEL69854.1 TPA: hypothetical protein BN1204_055530 [Neospora caninum Liverpool]|eukprot:XP_003885156.1 conserved hypothetical protein [Neospora caninum Liverpool]
MPRASEDMPGTVAGLASWVTGFTRSEISCDSTKALAFEGISALRSSGMPALHDRQDGILLSVNRPCHLNPSPPDRMRHNLQAPYEPSGSHGSTLAQTRGGLQIPAVPRHSPDSRDWTQDGMCPVRAGVGGFSGPACRNTPGCRSSPAETFPRRSATSSSATVSLRLVSGALAPGGSKFAVENEDDSDAEAEAGCTNRQDSATCTSGASPRVLKKESVCDWPLKSAGKSSGREVSTGCLPAPFSSASVDLASRAIINLYTAAAKESTVTAGAPTLEAMDCRREHGHMNLFMWLERRKLKPTLVRSQAYDAFRMWCCSGNSSSCACAHQASVGAESPLSSSQRVQLLSPEILPPLVKASFDTVGARRIRAGCPHQWTWKGDNVIMALPPASVLASRGMQPALSEQSRPLWRRASTDDGRLQGWTEEQLEVRVAVRQRQPRASGLRGFVRRMSKKVTFSLDTPEKVRSRDGEDGGNRQWISGFVPSPVSETHATGGHLGGNGHALRTANDSWREEGRLSRQSSSGGEESSRRSSRSMSRTSDTSQDGTPSSVTRRGRSGGLSRRRRGLSPLPLLLDLLGEDEPFLSQVVLEPQLDQNDGNYSAHAVPRAVIGAAGSGWGDSALLPSGPGVPGGTSRGLYHPLDRPETLFPQARARHLRRQFFRHRSAPGGSPISWATLNGELSKYPSLLVSPPVSTPLAPAGVSTAPTSCSSSVSSRGNPESTLSGSESVSKQEDSVPCPDRGKGKKWSAVCKLRTTAPPAKGQVKNRPSRLSRFLSHWKLSPVTTLNATEREPPPPAVCCQYTLSEIDQAGRQVMELPDGLCGSQIAESGCVAPGVGRAPQFQLAGSSAEREVETERERRRFSEEARTAPRTREGTESPVFSRTPRKGVDTETIDDTRPPLAWSGAV